MWDDQKRLDGGFAKFSSHEGLLVTVQIGIQEYKEFLISFLFNLDFDVIAGSLVSQAIP